MTDTQQETDLRDRDIDVRNHFDHATRQYLLSVLNDALVAEHRRFPAHPSEPLARLLAWCQRRPIDQQYAVKGEADGSFRLITFTSIRGRKPAYVGEDRFKTLEDARHAAFLRHVKDLTGQ